MPTLTWIGKEKVVSHHQDVPYKVLDHKYGFSSDNIADSSFTGSGNKIIHGDNLLALKSLMPEYEGRVDCIYIDPPYNTGEEKWVYNDNVNDPRIKKWLGEVVGKQGEDLCRHDKWLCMMYPRLTLLKQLLKEEGVIFISIDDNELSNLKILCDEVFGKNNFVGQWMWFKSATPPNLSHKIKKNLEYVLGYEKRKDNIKYQGIKKTSASNDPFTKPQNSIKRLTFGPHTINVSLPDGIVEAGTYGTDAYPNILVNDMIVKDGLNENEVQFDNRFIWEQSTLEKNIGEGTYIACSKQLVLSYKKAEYAPEVPPNLIDESIGVSTTEEAGKRLKEMFGKKVFDYPKDVSLIKYLLRFKDDENAIILDSFAGSGTTGQAVLELNKEDGGNRKFILIELMDYADTLTAQRVKYAAAGYNYKGEIEEELYRKKITKANLKNGEKWLTEAKSVSDGVIDGLYSSVETKFKDGELVVTGIKEIEDKMPGIGGSFDFYELGASLFMEDGTINPAVSEDKIREYVYYSETRQHLTREKKAESKYLLDTHNEVGYYLFHENGEQTTLTINSLEIITEKAEHYVVYADSCTISPAQLDKLNITFKQLPQEIKRV